MRYLLPLLLVLFLLPACGDDDEMEIKTFDSFEAGAYVINRGTAGVEAASVSYYISDCLQGTNNIFQAANGFSLPDELRDLAFTGDGKVLLLLPTQIIVATETDFVQLSTIEGISNARQIEVISPSKAYVSQYNAPGVGFGIRVIDLNTGQITNELLAGRSADQMLTLGTSLYTANTGGNFIDSTLSKIDVLSNTELSTFEVGYRPTGLAADANGAMWVLCEGVLNNLVNPDSPDNVLGALVQLNNDVETKRFSLGAGARNLAIDRQGENVIYVNRNWTYKLPITATTVPLIPLITNSSNGYDVEPSSGLLFGANAGDFVEPGTIWIYNISSGDTLATFTTGNAPLEVVFR